MKKEIICTVCPQGCHIMIEGTENEILSVSGHTCKRGLEYATAEFLHPVRILTTTIKLENGDAEHPLAAVRSDKPIPKELLFACMEVVRDTTARTPIQLHQVLIENICGSGANMVASAAVSI